jgi:hypothetical protein
MQDPEREALRSSVELLHKCEASFLQDEVVRVTSGSVTIQRHVATFVLRGDPAPAPLAYAWTDSLVGDKTFHHQVVLHQGVVKSPQLAVAGFFLTDSPSQPTSSTTSGAMPLWWAEGR